MKIVVLGGGTGTFTVLSGLKEYDVDLSAVVSIADDGGSTGILRDELGVLPPGDIRQCLVALSAGDDTLRRLFTYRFQEGSLSGHNFGNLFLSALEKVTGDPLSAIKEAHRILQVHGRVIPVSAQASILCAELEDGSVVQGQHAIDESSTGRSTIKHCFLSYPVAPNPDALDALRSADIIVLGPGDLYTSLIPVLLTPHVAETIAGAPAKCLYIMNLVTKHGQTDGFTAKKYVEIVEQHLAGRKLDQILLNDLPPASVLLDRYQAVGESLVEDDLGDDSRVLRAELISNEAIERVPGDRIRRSLLRHDSKKLAASVMQRVLMGHR